MHPCDWLRSAAGAVVLMGLAGCASIGGFPAEVSTFGNWPAGRTAGTYAFERLPSQQAQAEAMQPLEAAAAPALAKAGFQPAAAGAQPDVLVQVGVRVSRADRSPWDDPLWWHGGWGPWRHGPWRGVGWNASWRLDPPRYDREVALLLRDRASGAPLFEARASSEGFQRQATSALQPLFAAALMDFPATGVNPRQVVVPTTP